MTPTVAPSAAPPDVPITYGSASGFLKRAWKRTPAADSAAPIRAAVTTRGNRTSSTIVASVADQLSGRHQAPARWSRMPATDGSGTATAPTDAATMIERISATPSAINIRRNRQAGASVREMVLVASLPPGTAAPIAAGAAALIRPIPWVRRASAQGPF